MFSPILYVAGEPIVFFMFAAAVLFQLCTTYNHINTKRVAIFFNHVSYVHLMSSSDSFCKCLQKKICYILRILPYRFKKSFSTSCKNTF